MLTVLETGERGHGRKFKVVCDCGAVAYKHANDVISGHTKSCGCMQYSGHGSIKHGLYYHPLHTVWSNIILRCCNQNVQTYKYYGGRGISICNEWRKSFFAFYTWCINNGWEKGLQLDRTDNTGNYAPDNCRFVSAKINCRNKRTNRFIEFQGETKTLAEWCEIYNIPYRAVHQRISKLKWDFKKAITQPIGAKHGGLETKNMGAIRA